MQVSLHVLIGLGLERGSLGIGVNATIGLGVTQLPAVLERDYHSPMDSALTLWITAAVFLHALGTAGLPGAETNFYRSIPWWDHMTHTLSSSIVAAVVAVPVGLAALGVRLFASVPGFGCAADACAAFVAISVLKVTRERTREA